MKAKVFITDRKEEAVQITQMLHEHDIHSEIQEEELFLENGSSIQGVAIITSLENENAAFALIDDYLQSNS